MVGAKAMNNTKIWAVGLILIFVMASSLSWGNDPASSTIPEVQRDQENATAIVPPQDMPYLPPGPHLGLIVGFDNVFPPDTQKTVEAALEKALAGGMKIGRVQADWSTIEASPGNIDLSGVKTELETIKRKGLLPFLTITTVDTASLSLPRDLLDPEDDSNMKLAEGMTFDNPYLLNRFKAVLDQAVPMLRENGGWLLAIGNEPGTWFEDDKQKEASLGNFIKACRDYIRTLDPQLPVTMTLDGIFPKLIRECDVACFNYYPEDDADSVTEEVIHAKVQEFIAAAEGRQVIIQELGCAAGYPPDSGKQSSMESSPERQRRFYELAVQGLVSQSKFRAAFAFQLVDWSPQTAQLWVDMFESIPEFPQDFVNLVVEVHRTIGLIRYEDGVPRPAWNAFLDGLRKVYDDHKGRG